MVKDRLVLNQKEIMYLHMAMVGVDPGKVPGGITRMNRDGSYNQVPWSQIHASLVEKLRIANE